MGQKISVTLLLTLIFGASLVSPPAFAEDKAYWTYEEMTELSREVEREVFSGESCQDGDFECRRDLFEKIIYRGGKYDALIGYEIWPLVISAVNPSKGTISVYFRDEYLENKLENHFEKDHIINLFIARYDKGQPIYNFYKDIQNGENLPEWLHLAVSETELNNGENWLAPNQEVVFQMVDPIFNENIQNKFWFYFETTTASWYDPINIENCVSSPDYREGMECRIVYRENGIDYIPMKATDIITELEAEQNLRDNFLTENTEENTTSTLALLAPDAGVAIINGDKVTEMPWWLLLLMLTGITVIFWWFLPEKYKKSQKIFKKGIDKNSGMR